jgi:hypothetical protein
VVKYPGAMLLSSQHYIPASVSFGTELLNRRPDGSQMYSGGNSDLAIQSYYWLSDKTYENLYKSDVMNLVGWLSPGLTLTYQWHGQSYIPHLAYMCCNT